MIPVILPGDYAVVDRAERPSVEINTRDIYLVDAAETGEEVALTLKYVQLLPGILRLKPLNTAVTIWTQSEQFRDQKSGQESGGKYSDPAFEFPLFPLLVQPLRVLLARLNPLI